MKVVLAVLMLYHWVFLNVVVRGQGSNVESPFGHCSRYLFCSFLKTIRPKTWEKAMEVCKNGNSLLVSIESKEEWDFLSRSIKGGILTFEKWFIGLRKSKESDQWCWVSDNKTCLGTGDREQRTLWPSGDGDCADTDFENGMYNDANCSVVYGDRGYICESKFDCGNIESSEDIFQSIKHSNCTELATPHSTFSTTISLTSKPESPNIHTTVRSCFKEGKTNSSTSDDSTSIVLAASLSALVLLIILIL